MSTAPKTSYRERICRYSYKNAHIAHFTQSRDNKNTTLVKKTHHFPTKNKHHHPSNKTSFMLPKFKAYLMNHSISRSPSFQVNPNPVPSVFQGPHGFTPTSPTLHPTPPPGYSYQWSAARSTSLDQNHIGGPLISIPPENTPPPVTSGVRRWVYQMYVFLLSGKKRLTTEVTDICFTAD